MPTNPSVQWRRPLLAAASVVLLLLSPLAAQDPEFEVAVVRTNTRGELRSSAQPLPGGRFRATNVTARNLIGFAYEAMPFEIEGGPSWLASTRYDVDATAGRETPQPELRQMLQRLLRDRFQLRAHRESREMPLYALLLARADGRLGPSLRQTAADCATLTAPGAVVVPDTPCGYFGPTPGAPIRGAGVSMRGVTMAVFARSMSGIVRRPVVDRTGLTGWWDADLGPTAELPPPPPPPGIPDAVVDRSDLPSVFSVLRDRLGLTLESIREPASLLVIESAVPPADEP